MPAVTTSCVVSTLVSSLLPPLRQGLYFERFSSVVKALWLKIWLHFFICLTCNSVKFPKLFRCLENAEQKPEHVELFSTLRSDRSGPKGAPLASAPWIVPCSSLTSPPGMVILMLVWDRSHDPVSRLPPGLTSNMRVLQMKQLSLLRLIFPRAVHLN